MCWRPRGGFSETGREAKLCHPPPSLPAHLHPGGAYPGGGTYFALLTKEKMCFYWGASPETLPLQLGPPHTAESGFPPNQN